MDIDDLFITFFALTAIIAIRYVAVSGLFSWLVRRSSTQGAGFRLTDAEPKPGAVAKEIRWSLVSSFIYAAPAALVIELWKHGGSAVYLDIDRYGWWYVPVSVAIYLFLHDTYFYWTHRLMHHKRVFPIVHRVHHESKPPTAWASFSFHPLESVLGAVFLPALALVVPIHVSGLLFILSLMTVCAVLNHCGYELLPTWWLKGWPGRHFISAAHHNLHHEHFRCNFALYFRFWDKLMATDVMESEYALFAVGPLRPESSP